MNTASTQEAKEFLKYLQKQWMYAPQVVSIETYAVCNAACNFCPYVTLDRIGSEMPMALIEKIISDIQSTGIEPQYINLSRVNEPFLDKRIFNIARMILNEFSSTKLVWFSNGSTLNEKNLDKLIQLERNQRLTISFNEYKKITYEKVMQIDFDKTVKNLDRIHALFFDKAINFNIVLSRVGDGTSEDNKFSAWCKDRYPLFSTSIARRFDWMGKVNCNSHAEIPDIGCSQWFKLHVLANGKIAYCCIDSDGKYGIGNARDLHLINDVYMNPNLVKLRKHIPSRKKVPVCNACPAIA